MSKKTVKPVSWSEAYRYAMIGQTIRIKLTPDDLESVDRAFGYDPETDSIEGNRSERSVGAKDLERLIPTAESFDPDISRIVLCGWGTEKTTCGDGGHRHRRNRTFLLDGQSVIVDILFSDRPPHMGGFDQCGQLRKARDEDETKFGDDGYAVWREQTGTLLRLRIAGSNPKGGGRKGRCWEGVELSPAQQADQWGSEGDFAAYWNLCHFAKRPGGQTLYELSETLVELDCGWNGKRDSQLLLCAVLDVAGIDQEDCLDLSDLFAQSLPDFAKHWRALVSKKPGPDVDAKYSALTGWLSRLANDQTPKLGHGPIVATELFQAYATDTEEETEETEAA